MIRALTASAVILAGMVTASTVASGPPRLTLADRIAMAQAGILADGGCTSDADCWARIAGYGLDPNYYEGPDEWLTAECSAGDATACRYRAAWRAVEAAE